MKSSGTNQKLSWFFKEARDRNLDLAPIFQRKPVWTDEMASYLIDSVLNAIPIPEVYVRSTSSPDGETRHEVVDGQQRIRSILRFASNDLSLVGEKGREISAKWAGKSFDDLSPADKTAFWGYELVVRDLGASSDGEIRDLFRRLNINQMPLTDQEIRHATYSGKFLKFVERLADDEWWLESKIVTVRQVRRMEDVEFVSELLIGMVAGPQNKKDTLDDYYVDYESEMPDGSRWQEQFQATLGLITSTMERGDIRAWSGKSDFYSLFLLFAGLAERRTRFVPAKRVAVRDALMKFRKSVDEAKKKSAKPAAGDVGAYVEAVTRAASDLSRRTTRLQILERVIAKVL